MAEKDFYKSLYRQVKQQNVSDTKIFSANLPPKPTFKRQTDEPQKIHMISVVPGSRFQTSELTCEGDYLDMFDVDRSQMDSQFQSLEEESKLSVYIQESQLESEEETNHVEEAFVKAMQRAETSITNFYSQLQDQYNPCNTTRDNEI